MMRTFQSTSCCSCPDYTSKEDSIRMRYLLRPRMKSRLCLSSSPCPLPMDLELHLPNGSKVISTESPVKKPKEEWVKLRIGKFATDAKNLGEKYFYHDETCQIYKSGLVLKGLRVDPKG